ncbi:MAG: hypothetical protein QNJ65_22335 [Xenococcaceae cyanobacterium MO_234.B1]|nr:hypothetical protein [Xenococcaceae cyanobacterium MO_234.B1]
MVAVRDWRISQRYIRIGHNKAIRNYFQTVKRGTTRESLRNSLLITSFDSADHMLVKMQYFNMYLNGVLTNTAPVIPEYWAMKVGSNRPQLVVVFKPKNNSNTRDKNSRWSLTIPHFNATTSNLKNQLKLIPDYDKGRYQGILTLKDNSKLIIYAKSINEAETFIRKIVNNNLINNRYIDRSNYQLKTGKINGNFKEVKVTPTYAKYFATGQKNLQPDWTAFIE